MHGASFFGRHSANHLRPVRDGLLAVERSVFAGEALHDHLGVLIHEHSGLGGIPASARLRGGGMQGGRGGSGGHEHDDGPMQSSFFETIWALGRCNNKMSWDRA